MSRKTKIFRFAAPCLIFLAFSKEIGAESCVPFMLRARDGAVINPRENPGVSEPYDTRATCGSEGCHDVETILKAYHFRMGADEMTGGAGSFGLSPGHYAGFNHYYFRFLAPRVFESPDEVDLTSYEWARDCGTCHPGGGPFEFDREGNRYDIFQKSNPEIAAGTSGDYWRAGWDRSGVAGPDCLICHLRKDYDFEERTRMIREGSFHQAATVAAGFARIGEDKRLVYNPQAFREDGVVRVERIPRKPADENCLFCHGPVFEERRGVRFPMAGGAHEKLSCVQCHPGDAGHQIAKGHTPDLRLRDDLDSEKVSCFSCHEEGRLDAPRPRHRFLPPIHLQKIDCTACHIREILPSLIERVDAGTGDVRYLNRTENRTSPSLHRVLGEDEKPGKITACNGQLTAFWLARRGAIYTPLHLREVQAGLARVRERLDELGPNGIWTEIKDDTGDGYPEVNRKEEIRAMIEGLREVLREEDRFRTSTVEPVYVNGHFIWEMSGLKEKEQLVSHEHRVARRIYRTVNHNVARADQALGAGGCTECHRKDSPIYAGQTRMVVYAAEDAVSDSSPTLAVLGFVPSRRALSQWREGFLRPVSPWVLLFVAVGCGIHFYLYGRKSPRVTREKADMVRFTLIERIVHWILLGIGVFVIVTGAGLLLGGSNPFGHWGRHVHGGMGQPFIAGMILAFIVWVRQVRMANYDRDWYRRPMELIEGKIPAGKFTVGQKLFFWIVMITGGLLAITGLTIFYAGEDFASSSRSLNHTLHLLCALVFLGAMIVHLYGMLILQPYRLNSLWSGRVRVAWAKLHHPKWQTRWEKDGEDERQKGKKSKKSI